MTGQRPRQVRTPEEHPFVDDLAPALAPSEHLDLEDLRNVKLTVAAELGKCTMLVREVIELKRGSVLALDKVAGEMIDLLVNGQPFAKGEVVVIEDSLHVRLVELVQHGRRGVTNG